MFGLAWKVTSTLAAVAAAAAAQRAVSAGWRAVTGNEPPSVPESPETRLREALAYSMIIGAALGAARVLATRQAAKYYASRAGELPKALQRGDD